MPCLTAVRISCNIPLVFEKYKYMNSYYMDGGISDNFPIQLVDKDDNKVLGINLVAQDKDDNPKEDFNFTHDLLEIIWVPVYQITFNKIKDASDNCKIFTIETASRTGFDIKNTEILELFSIGYQEVKNSLEVKEEIEFN